MTLDDLKKKISGWNWKDFVAGVAAGAILCIAGAYVIDQHEDAQFREEVREANREAVQWKLAWNESQNAYEERGLQLLDQQAVLEAVRQENAQLARSLEESDAEILSLQQTTTRLKAQLDSSATKVEQTDSTEYTVALDESVSLQGGGFVRVLGDVTVVTTGPSVRTDLSVGGEFTLDIVLSRTEDGEIQVNAFTGDPRLRVTQLDVKKFAERPSEGFSGDLLDGLENQITGVGPWINRGVGYAVCEILNSTLLSR